MSFFFNYLSNSAKQSLALLDLKGYLSKNGISFDSISLKFLITNAPASSVCLGTYEPPP